MTEGNERREGRARCKGGRGAQAGPEAALQLLWGLERVQFGEPSLGRLIQNYTYRIRGRSLEGSHQVLGSKARLH